MTKNREAAFTWYEPVAVILRPVSIPSTRLNTSESIEEFESNDELGYMAEMLSDANAFRYKQPGKL